MAIAETIASLVGGVPSRSDALRVWERPTADTNFPRTVAEAIIHHAKYLDGIQAIQTSLQRPQTTHGSATEDAASSPAPENLARRLAVGLSARRSKRQGISRCAVELYAAYERVDADTQVQENELASAVEMNLDSLSRQAVLLDDWERFRPDVSAVLLAGQNLEDRYTQEQRLLRKLANRLPRGQRAAVKKYRQNLAMDRTVPVELSTRHVLFANDAIGQALNQLWFENNGQEDGQKAVLKNFMQRVGVVRVWNIKHAFSNLNARIHGEPGNLSKYTLVALPFMPVARLLSAKEAIASANTVLAREYTGETVDSYSVYRALQSRQNALEQEAQIVDELRTQSEFDVEEQPVVRAYTKHVSRPLVKIGKSIVEAAASFFAFFPLS